MKKLITFLVLPFLAVTASAQHQSQDRAQVMILGVYHFDNPNLDAVKTNFPDHLSEEKQQQIAEVLDLLAKFKPIKIAVEVPPEQTIVQENYQAYLRGEHTLRANETEQIGFRLAKRLGHKQIYLADHRLGMDMNSVIAAAQETGNKNFLKSLQTVIKEVEEMQTRHGRITVREALMELNQPDWQHKTRDLYLQLSRVRSKSNYVGADVLADWYRRNFRIFTNLSGVIQSPEDRVLVIFGQSHAPYLREAVSSSRDMQLVEPNDYLNTKN